MKGEVAHGVEEQTKGYPPKGYYPPSGGFAPPLPEEEAWSHSLGSGAPLPGNMDEEISRFNLTATTTVPAGEPFPMQLFFWVMGLLFLFILKGYGRFISLDKDECFA